MINIYADYFNVDGSDGQIFIYNGMLIDCKDGDMQLLSAGDIEVNAHSRIIMSGGDLYLNNGGAYDIYVDGDQTVSDTAYIRMSNGNVGKMVFKNGLLVEFDDNY
jgi:hypothetical protein